MKPIGQVRPADESQPPRPRWRRLLELECVLLLVAVGGLYFVRLDQPNLRGEETRRGRVAVEMIQTGDWIVPRQQSELFLSRPPLQNWLIAAAGLLRGRVDDLAIRWPSVLAILLTAWLIYGYSRHCVSPAAALVAGLSFATMIQVLELGRLGETEALFTLTVGGSLLVWHWGWTRGWSPSLTWGLAYLLVAMGMLLKGPQAPVFFAGPVGLYLIATRQWRGLVSWPHAIGLAVFAAVWNAWQLPYWWHVGSEATWNIYAGDVARRFEDRTLATLLAHVALYPWEIAGCLLPWSPLLVVIGRGPFWNWLGRNRSHVIFLLCSLAATFPICWLVPGARGRYYMPLYPCCAVLIGLVAEYAWQAATGATWRSVWRQFMAGTAIVMALAAPAVLLLNVMPQAARFAQPWSFVAFFAAAAALLACLAWWSATGITLAQRRTGPLTVAAFLALAYIGLATNIRSSTSNDTQQQVAMLKRKLPSQARLVSLGLVHHTFTYYFEQPIQPLDALPAGETWPGETDYFCFKPLPGEAEKLDFAWEQIAVITCDRNRTSAPDRIVVVARRLPAGSAALASHIEPATDSTSPRRR